MDKTANTRVPTYFVPAHVHVCATSGMAVMLDVRGDRYYGFDARQTRALAHLIAGWPAGNGHPNQGHVDSYDVSPCLVWTLVERGLLTPDGRSGRPVAPVRLPEPQERLDEWEGDRWPVIDWFDVGRFARAYITVLLRLRRQSLERTLTHVASRKTTSERRHPNMDHVRGLLRKFRCLRPFFYTSRDRCLFDSLVLLEFLAHNGVFPMWVIGVKPSPFAAHSWVQMQGAVLNGSPEFVRSFVPIVAV